MTQETEERLVNLTITSSQTFCVR